MKILMILAALMLVAGLALADVVLGVCGLVPLAMAAFDLLDRRFSVYPDR